MSIQISGSNLTTGLNNTVLSAPYGSLSFNGQNQSVLTSGTGSGANGTILDLTTGAPNWTIEFWIYSSQHSRNAVPQYFLNQGNGQNVLFSLIASESVSSFTQNNNCIQFAFYSTTLGWVYMNSWPTALSLNTWYHVAVCKDTTDGNRYYLYLNGVLVSATPNISNPQVNNGQPYELGYPVNYITGDSQYAFNGLLSNIRIVKGVALYVTPDVTVPTPPLASTQSLNLSGFNQAITGTQTSLLLTTPNNGSYLTDTSSYAQTVTGVNTPTSSSLGPDTYTGSILFNGTNQYLSIARAAQFNYSTNDFTWEMWIYPTAATWTSGVFYLIDHGPNNNQGTLHYASNKLVYYNYYNAANIPPYTSAVQFPSLYTISGGSIAANTWTHVAVCRQNLVTRIFLNGKLVSSGPDPYDYAVQSGSPFTVPPITPASQSVTIGTVSSVNQYFFKGNISNIRIVNGVSIYNAGNFTPPVRPLPPVQVPNEIGSPSKAIFGSQTSLLMNTAYNNGFLTDSSFNQVTLNQVTTGVFPPSTYTMASNSTNPFNSNGSIFTPGSIFFNGTSQYLSVASTPTLALSTSDFTVECWVNWSSLTTSAIIDNQSSGGFSLYYDAGVYLSNYLVVSNRIVNQLTYPWVPALNTWYHIAIARSGTTIRMFINGVLVTSATGDTTDYQAGIYQIGADLGPGAGGWYLNGYLSNLRIVKGAAAYTQSFIPTSGPFTTSQTFNQSGIPSCPVQSSQTSLLLTTPSNSSYLTDSSTNAFTVTNVGTATSTPFNPFSGNYTILSNPGSVQLNGTSQYLTLPSNTALNVESGDFTVECWVYLNAVPSGTPEIFNSGDFHLNFRSSANLAITNDTTILSNLSNTIATGTWTHVAAVRASGTMTIYLNGVGNTPATGQTYSFVQGTGQIGSQNGASGPFLNGYISNLRVVKGLAVYTANFVPPAGPLNNSQAVNQSGAPSAAVTVSQTSLLLNTAFGTNFLTDGSINNFTVTNNGTATSSTLDPFVF